MKEIDKLSEFKINLWEIMSAAFKFLTDLAYFI